MGSNLSAAAAALETLDEAVESDTDLIDLLDNFEVIASTFGAWLLPSSPWRRKHAPLHAVLRVIGKVRNNKSFQELARAVKSQTKEIRRAAYGGFERDMADLIREANELRENLQEVLAKLFPATSDVEDEDENDSE